MPEEYLSTKSEKGQLKIFRAKDKDLISNPNFFVLIKNQKELNDLIAQLNEIILPQ